MVPIIPTRRIDLIVLESRRPKIERRYVARADDVEVAGVKRGYLHTAESFGDCHDRRVGSTQG